MKKKFNENLNTPVLTSKHVIYDKSPIVYVAHHEDGTWEFWGNENVLESEIIVASLEQIIKLDPTILEVANLPIQFAAIRENKKQAWQFVSKN